MAVLTPPAPPSTPDPDIEAGVIEDARARQRRHRRTGGILLATAAGAAIAGFAGGGGDRGTGHHASEQPASSGPGGSAAHASGTGAFPGAPSTQRGSGVETGDCRLAAPNRYLPPRSGCVTVKRFDIDGDGRPDLILVYSRISHRRPSGYLGHIPPSLARTYVADAAFLRVVLADGTTVTSRVKGSKAAAVASIAHVNELPGGEIFLELSQISSGASAAAYGFNDGRLVPAGVELRDGGDSASSAGFDCRPGNPPRLIQRTFALIGPTISGAWKETRQSYFWDGPRLRTLARHTTVRHGMPPADQTDLGAGCTSEK